MPKILRIIRDWRRFANLQTQLVVSHLSTMAFGAGTLWLLERVSQHQTGDEWEVVILGLLVVLLTSTSIGRLIVRPVKVLEQQMQTFASGELTARVAPSPIPELHRLGLGFNYLAESLQGIEERRRTLIAELLHEIRTPVSILYANLRLWQKQHTELLGEDLAMLLEEVENLEQLANSANLLSQVEDGVTPRRAQKLAIAPLIRRLVTNLAALEQDCQLEVQCSTDLPEVYADPGWLRQILGNLLRNACTYAPRSRIVVRAWRQADMVWVAITDQGVGIAHEELPYIFDRFWRSKTAKQLQPQGQGIGLPLVKRLVELQGGEIIFESQEGHGTTFQPTFRRFQTSR